MSIDDYEDEEWQEFDFYGEEEEEEESENEIDTDLLKSMIKMTRKREKKEQEWALKEREEMIKEEEKVSGPTFFNPKDLCLPQGESV